MVTVLPGLYRSIYSAWFTRFRCGKVAGFNSSKEILVCFGAFSEPEKTVKRRLGMLASHDWILPPGQNTHSYNLFFLFEPKMMSEAFATQPAAKKFSSALLHKTGIVRELITNYNLL